MIVSCGEALIDFLPLTGPDGGQLFQPATGGSLFNVARGVGRLGVPAGFFGGLSRDLFGAMLARSLSESGVDLGLTVMTDRPSTLAFVTFVNGSAVYAFFDEGSAGRMLTSTDLPALPDEVAALHFGSFSLAEEPCGTTLEALARREHPRRVVSLDINVRPSLTPDRASYVARLDRMIAMADIVKLSDEDFAWLHGKADAAEFARTCLDRGTRLVVLTRGGEGAIAYTARQTIDVAPVPVTVVDTVGAGDSFMSALLSRLYMKGLLSKESVAGLSRAALDDALAFAARAAAITVSRAGADSPWVRELQT
jgi:fructokinase